jgi:hypothetical protein
LPSEGCLLAIKACAAYPKIPAGLGNVTNLLGMPENPEFALNILFYLEHRKHPFCSVEHQKNVSQVRTYLQSLKNMQNIRGPSFAAQDDLARPQKPVAGRRPVGLRQAVRRQRE